MERIQLIRKMYLQGTISLSAAIILTATDEERQEIKDLHELLKYQKLRNGIKNGIKSQEIDSAWDEYANQNNQYDDDEYYLDIVNEMSKVNNITNYCYKTYIDISYMYDDYTYDYMCSFDSLLDYMTKDEEEAYNLFCTHAKEREIAEEWVNGNIVSVPSGLDLTYITSHYHTLLPYHLR